MSAEEPSWSGGACPSRLTTVGQSRSQALHTKGYPFLISGLLPGSTQISQNPTVKWWLPQRVPVCVKTGERERNPDECPLNRNLQVGAVSVKRLLGSVHPCPAQQKQWYLREQSQRVRKEVAGGIRKLSGVWTGWCGEILTTCTPYELG